MCQAMGVSDKDPSASKVRLTGGKTGQASKQVRTSYNIHSANLTSAQPTLPLTFSRPWSAHQLCEGVQAQLLSKWENTVKRSTGLDSYGDLRALIEAENSTRFQ